MPPRPSNIFESNTETTATMPAVMGFDRKVGAECCRNAAVSPVIVDNWPMIAANFHRNEPVQYRPQTLSKGLPLSTQLVPRAGGWKCHGGARFVAHFRRTQRLENDHRKQAMGIGVP
jgi:hypothetical protein